MDEKVGHQPRKIQILYDVLSVEKSVLLGDSPPQRVKHIFLAYRQNVKGRSRWKVQDIAGPIYIMGKFVTERLEARKGHGKPNSKMEALSVMYLFYMQEIALKDERRHLASKATRKATKSSRATNPLPPDFVFNPKMVRLYFDIVSQWGHLLTVSSLTNTLPGCRFSLPSLPM